MDHLVKIKSITAGAQQVNKALFSNLNLSIDLQKKIELFNKTVKPFLLYGCEIWGYGNFDDLGRVQLKFLKYALNVKKSTPTFMIYGELGVTRLSIDIINRVISFWSRLLTGTENKLSSSIYTVIYQMHKNNQIQSEYMNNSKNIINTCGFSGIWDSQSIPNSNWFKLAVSRKLND